MVCPFFFVSCRVMFRVMFVSKCIDILHIFRLYQNNKILRNRINTAFLCLWDFSDIISE